MRKRSKTRNLRHGKALSGQRGAVIPIVVIGLVAMMAVAGMAIDSSHALANKTRMQNTCDAAVLAAAKVLDQTDGDTGLATAAADNLFSLNADGLGNHELNRAYDAGDITVLVEYSVAVTPFAPGAPNGPFVRVTASGFETQTTLSRVLNINEIPTPASCVAGPSGPLGAGEGGELCDITPIAVCTDDVAVPLDSLRVLKPNPGVHGDVGPGNYKMLRLDCPGGACLREAMAGGTGACAVNGEEVDTEPGVSSGPTSQGFNTRFNIYQGGGMNPDDYPPDEFVSEQGPPQELKSCEDPNDPLAEHIYLSNGQGNNFCNGFDPNAQPWAGNEIFIDTDVNYNHTDYESDPSTPITGGLPGRRILKFPLVDCAGDQNGQSQLEVMGFACFFMLQSLVNGQADGNGQIFGQYIESCLANGSGGINPGGGPAPLLYKIQLYKDYDSGDS